MIDIITTCLLLVQTPQGNVCIKPDWSVSVPKDADQGKLKEDFIDVLNNNVKCRTIGAWVND